MINLIALESATIPILNIPHLQDRLASTVRHTTTSDEKRSHDQNQTAEEATTLGQSTEISKARAVPPPETSVLITTTVMRTFVLVEWLISAEK